MRVPAHVPLRFRIIRSQEPEFPTEMQEASVIDVSGGGLSFSRPVALRSGDLISMMAHGEATRNMTPDEYLGNVILLIVGGNDTTRNSISGGLYALNKFPGEYDKLRVCGLKLKDGAVKGVKYLDGCALVYQCAMYGASGLSREALSPQALAKYYQPGEVPHTLYFGKIIKAEHFK